MAMANELNKCRQSDRLLRLRFCAKIAQKQIRASRQLLQALRIHSMSQKFRHVKIWVLIIMVLSIIMYLYIEIDRSDCEIKCDEIGEDFKYRAPTPGSRYSVSHPSSCKCVAPSQWDSYHS